MTKMHDDDEYNIKQPEGYMWTDYVGVIIVCILSFLLGVACGSG